VTKTTEVLEEPDVFSSVDLQANLKANAEVAGESPGDIEAPSQPAECPDPTHQKQIETQSVAGHIGATLRPRLPDLMGKDRDRASQWSAC